MTTIDERLKVGRAALAEAGIDPGYLNQRDGRLYINLNVPLEIQWRAYELMRQAWGSTPCCRQCFGLWAADGVNRDIVDQCDSTRIFDLDCGRSQ
jgi:hypothetical protein